jgi:hypothetical protein
VLVVADGTLWTVNYSEQGELLDHPKQTDECTIYFGKDYYNPVSGVSCTISHMHVFTKLKFDGFLDRVVTNDRYWELIFPSESLERHLIGA